MDNSELFEVVSFSYDVNYIDFHLDKAHGFLYSKFIITKFHPAVKRRKSSCCMIAQLLEEDLPD